MKIPRRINDILNQRQDFIDLHRDKLEKSIIKLQSELLDQVIAEIVPSLDIKDGIIQDSKHNYRVLSELDKVYDQFESLSTQIIASHINTATVGILDLGRNYFAVTLTDDIGARFDKVISATASKMNARIGIEGGKIVRGGFLESVLKDTTVRNQVKNYISKSITGQVDSKDFLKGLTKMVHGDGGPGALEKQYQRYTYDLYQQYDRAYNNSLADEFDMNYFIYQGGLIDDSRDFCAAHNAKVWSREEAAEWPEWTPSKGEYPAGYIVKQKDIYAVPSYLKVDGYDPLVDFGGPRCRHGIGWISDELAIQLRPDLKIVNKNI